MDVCMMKSKTICAGIIVILLLAGFTTIPVFGKSIEKSENGSFEAITNNSTTVNSSWVEIIKPINGAFKFGPLLIMSRASSDVYHVNYGFGYDWDRDGDIEWTWGGFRKEPKKPFYATMWFKPVIPRSEVIIRVSAYNRTYHPDPYPRYSYSLVAEDRITITKLL